MTALAEKLKAAGADTIGAQLIAECTVAARLHPGNPELAWRAVGGSFGYDLIRGIMADMAPSTTKLIKWDDPVDFKITSALEVKHDQPPVVKPYRPKVITAERLEKRRELQAFVRSKYKTSDGRLWGDITPHEALAMSRDGGEAAALLAALPPGTPNDGRAFSEHLGWKAVDDILKAVRSGA